MGERVRITDVSPRDGLQNEAVVIATPDKVRLIELLSATGLDEVEATSFVSPRWMPQLADAGEVMAAVAAFVEGVRSVTSVIPRDETREQVGGLPTYSVLVPNEKGFERALAVREAGLPLKIALFTAASETFSKKNTNASVRETFERFEPIVRRAREHDVDIRGYVSCAIECPYEGPIDPKKVEEVAFALYDMGIFEIDLADTIGVATPDTLGRMLEAVRARLADGDAEHAWLTLHLHDTQGRAPACVERALEFGIRSFDGSAAGLGGCPFASTPERRAPGNLSTETLVRTIHGAGYETGVDLELLGEAASFAREIVSRAREGETGGGA